MEDLDIWEDFLQISFANSISKIFKNLYNEDIYHSFALIFNPLIKYLMKIIYNNDKAVTSL